MPRGPAAAAAGQRTPAPPAAPAAPPGSGSAVVTASAWWADAVDCPAGAEALLSPPERERLATLRDPRDRDARRAAWVLLRLLLGKHLGCAPAAVPLDRTCATCGAQHGPPRGPAGAPHVSLSHSAGRVLVALSGAPVGVDVERVVRGRDVTALAGQALAVAEQEALWTLTPDAVPAAFTRLWTRKEAVLKATGEGLPGGPEHVLVTAPWVQARLFAHTQRPSLVAELRDLAGAGRGYEAAIAVLTAAPLDLVEHDAAPLLSAP